MTDQQIDKVSQRVVEHLVQSEPPAYSIISQAIASSSPLDRVGLPQDVSRVVAFLCSQDGEWINGQVITIGGGAHF